MAALLEPQIAVPSPYVPNEPTRLRWTWNEFLGLLEREDNLDRRLLLLDGDIYEMASPNAPHVTSMTLLAAILPAVFGNRAAVRNQAALPIGLDTEPFPDFAIASGPIRDYATRHPHSDEILLVIEVSDSTLRFDLNVKSHLYAAAGFREYWVLDIANRKLHVHRDPIADDASPRGHRYGTLQVLGDGESIAPLAAADSLLAIADMLP